MTDKTKEELAIEAEGTLELVKTIKITSADENQYAADTLKDITSHKKTLNNKRLEMTRPLDKSKKSIIAFFKKPLDYLDEAERLVKNLMLTYHTAEEAKRKAAEEKVRKAQAAAAARAEKKGEEPPAPVAMVAKPAVKTAGAHVRVTWDVEVTDLMALLKAIVAGTQPESLVSVNMATLRGMAVALKDDLNIPGVKAVKKSGIAAR